MSRFSGKSRAGAGAKGFASHASTSFGAFASSGGGRLSYLFEPPDFSSVSDPNIVVSLKNVLKKDSTTKARALEDLVTYVQSIKTDGGVEEAVLDAWVQLYPRTAIDNSRRVRELAHSLLVDLLKSGRKRMERRIPKIVGSWLAGTYDKDRVVARAASDGLQSLLSNEEKQLLFWKKCQPQILEYAIEAVQETPDSLSDERSTSKDDSDAKYYRVLGAGLSLVLGLLQRLSAAEMQPHQESYDEFFSLDTVWDSVKSGDSFVRRQCCQLLWLSMEKQDATIEQHIPKIAKTLISDSLKSNQVGSALELVRILTRLTKRHPEIWGTKKPPLSRLRPFLEKGSQSSPSPGNFWSALDQLFDVMPKENLEPKVVADVLRSVRTGVSNRDEPRNAAVDAWSFYLSVCRRLVTVTEPAESRSAIVVEFVHPLIEHYIQPAGDKPIAGLAAQLEIATKAVQMLSLVEDKGIVDSIRDLWTNAAQSLGTRLIDTLSEAPQDYTKAQKLLADEGTRFFSLIAALKGTSISSPKTTNSGTAVEIASPPTLELLDVALETLTKDAYRPFAAASILESACTKTPFILDGEQGVSLVKELFPTSSPTQMETMLSSASAPSMLSCLLSLNSIQCVSPHFEKYWKAVVHSLLAHPDENLASRYLTRMVAHVQAASLACQEESLQKYLGSSCLGCAQGTMDRWELFETCFTFDVLASDVAGQIAKNILDLFNNSEPATIESALKALDIIAHRKPAFLSQDEDLHLALVTKLLTLAEIPNDRISSHAAGIRLLLETHNSTEGGPQLVRIIQENLETAGPASLGIETLVQQAAKISKMADVSMEQLFPSTTIWFEELAQFLQGSLDPSLSLTNNLGGVYFLAAATAPEQSQPSQRDRQGLAVPARMAIYTKSLLESGFKIDMLPVEFQVELLCLLYLSTLVVSDQIVLMEDDKLWGSLAKSEDLMNAEEFVTSARNVLKEMLMGPEGEDVGSPHLSGLSGNLIKLLLTQARTLSPLAIYSARALSEILQALAEKHGFKPAQQEEWISSLDVLKATPATVLPCAAILAGYRELLASSRTINTLLNRLISDVAGSNADSLQTLLTLILLDACLTVYGADALPVANNRLVFAIKQITSWFETPETVGSKTATETCRVLTRLLPNIKDVYGSYWEKTLDFCKHLGDRAGKEAENRRLPYVHASLKLISALESLDEPNDDLEDAMQAFSEHKRKHLIGLLQLQESSTSQPAEIVNSLLCRQVDSLPPGDISELGDVYGLVDSVSRDVQSAAFNLLHRAIPRAQEKLSVDIVLEKSDVRLPDELLSLLLDPPTLEAFHDELIAGFPTPVRSYFLAWHLIFDAFSAASFPLRNAYTENLKATNSLEPMLNFTFDVLGHSAAHPLNLNQAHLADSISSYDLQTAETEPDERAMQWLLVHVYYLALKYLPGLVKGWYINCRSKQTRIAVESWTTRYFSPVIISQTLDDVAKWADEQEPPAEDEKELIIKASKLSREVIVGYEVDDLQASISIRLPPAYPLEPVSVASVNRVAVNEKKWQSWLMTTQGVITFSNGSIVDGIATFRRNVIGAMKGQTECAICYSIISTDRRVPDKRCGTCKNLFHRGCLYQWFQTSNQNTCPLCRNPIDYLGAPARRDQSWVD
ncbi:hypothetical protein MCOR27_007551 [Pyricularia oryzae]|uniref:E3 ubiquitin-protein ligase listerin n=1 Tax=Pyricularia grisea TaxID=148305 RepID=A0ABQ8NLX4_PYRGI|nr:hypothetical protein MCOR01_005712 [Pyricularia oryzae]KAI6299120.1 hypothetical protein MCOR33_004885 [Pyricularia grisea]KAH9434925.1 hypothetical protein MCOR02_003891 [Pyricularia oryzae]KAI6260981.1 hypothetical protein MCOR19_002744 [Pyricularia oryzae]KAI6266742.1 hypothetical protein MCOR26_010017 [Pyricularia oryzae]